jgi:hypothetical protein
MEPVAATLQISLAPSDLPHARVILAHQLRTWAAQVQEVLLTVDGLRGAGHGRFAEGWDERRPGLDALLDEAAAAHPHLRVAEVDYAAPARAAVAERFFAGAAVPEKDSRGGPFYAYFFALAEARHDTVLHLDSDMLFGGGSPHWMREAAELLAARDDVLACNPLGGPPTDDPARWRDPREPLPSLAFRCSSISSRVCLLDRRRLSGADGLAPRPPARLRSRLKARLHGHPDAALPEDLLTAAMHARGMARLDLLGSAPGMWSLHPPFRSQRFYAELPALVDRIERGDVPDAQRGEFDVADALFDFSEARAAFRRRRWIS